jgi:hypothetical protein
MGKIFLVLVMLSGLGRAHAENLSLQCSMLITTVVRLGLSLSNTHKIRIASVASYGTRTALNGHAQTQYIAVFEYGPDERGTALVTAEDEDCFLDQLLLHK